jgi:hypothetical protein
MHPLEKLLMGKEAHRMRLAREIDAIRLSLELLQEAEPVPPARVAGLDLCAVFPQPRDGVIVCDACGYKNPAYVTDCESCDIPVRPRD